MSRLVQENEGFLARLGSTNVLIAALIIGGIYLLDALVAPRLDPQEPPLLKPKVPLIGHIIGILWHHYDYHYRLHDKNQVPIASLQMLWGKIYAIWDPTLAQASLRSKALSFEPFVLEFAEKSFNLKGETLKKVLGNPKLVPEFTDAIHASMQPKYVHEMNITALRYMSEVFDGIEPGDEGALVCENMYDWLKDLITVATTQSLLGRHSPFTKDPSLYDDLWTFEGGLSDLLTKPFPSITCRKAFYARNRLQHALGLYYEAQHDLNDPETSQICRGRADSLRNFNFTGMEIGLVEVMLPVVGITNSAPMQYSLICHLFSKPDLILRLRDELLPLLEKDTKDNDVTIVDINRLETDCPLLVSCYRENLRLGNFNVSIRRIMQDTTISDGNGRSYLLKKGVDIQISGGVLHREREIWGDDVLEFNPERFLAANTTNSKEDRVKKNAYIPFGGGRHLCPGRNFAFAEILAVTCALVLGFELTSVGMTFAQMQNGAAVLGNASYKPKAGGKGLGVKIKRREGWEKTKWRFVA